MPMVNRFQSAFCTDDECAWYKFQNSLQSLQSTPIFFRTVVNLTWRLSV